MPNAVEMIRQDHERMRQLFQQCRSAPNADEKKVACDDLLASLEAHAKVEEDIFYPAVKERTKQELLIDVAEEEHHGAELFAMELARMDPHNPRYDAKLVVLQENVERHMEEEESQILPQAEHFGPEFLESLGRQMEERWPRYREEADKMVHGGVMATAKTMFEQVKESLGRD